MMMTIMMMVLKYFIDPGGYLWFYLLRIFYFECNDLHQKKTQLNSTKILRLSL